MTGPAAKRTPPTRLRFADLLTTEEVSLYHRRPFSSSTSRKEPPWSSTAGSAKITNSSRIALNTIAGLRLLAPSTRNGLECNP